MFKDFIEKNKSIYEKDAYEVVINKYIEEINSEDIHGYAYYELKFNEEPTYDSFVSKIIRTKYSADEEAALKSNMVEQFMNGEIMRSRFEEWQAFQNCRDNAKSVGRQIFNI